MTALSYNTSYSHHLFCLNNSDSMSWKHDVEFNLQNLFFFPPLPPQLTRPMLSTPEEHSFQMRNQGMLLFGERHVGFGDNVLKAFFCCPSPTITAFVTQPGQAYFTCWGQQSPAYKPREKMALCSHRQLNHHVINLFTSFLVKKHTCETCKTQWEDKPLRQH